MLYYSTADPRHRVGFIEAISRGLPPGGGYYMPERLPIIPKAFFNNMADMSLKDIGYVVVNTLFGEDLNSSDLKSIVSQAINFDTPLVPDPAYKNLYALELFHGPSKSYKDFGARFMAHTLRMLHRNKSELNIIVATTGDAGEAVAHSFHDLPGTRVFVLYPRSGSGMRKLSSFASLGGNIVPVEVRGSFSQCHDMVKAVFADSTVRNSLNLFAANSFNLARLLPQTIYYFYAYAQLLRAGADVKHLAISLPSGNLGNLTAGLIAKNMGLPAERIIAVRTGEPDVLHSYLHQGIMPSPTNDMDVPPNFWRLLTLYGNSREKLSAESGSILIPEEYSSDPVNSCNDRFSEAARQSLIGLEGDFTSRVYLATSFADTPGPLRSHAYFKPAATLSPSPVVFRDFLIRYCNSQSR
ncbi:MAG: pyridoxal-phosphate dependent enzyme [Bacteroides sp.]|nr:pyridoxal-phosphate dependent enzyme [Bacteroides sp.]